MTELPKTEQELNDLIAAKVQEKADELTAKHNGEMATQRKKYDDDLKKAKEQAGKTAEELAQEKIKEQQERDAQELAELRQFKKNTVLGEKLKKEGLPDYFKNDTRLLNAEDEKVDDVIKTIEKEYKGSLPQGATINTNVVGTNTGKSQQDAELERVRKLGLKK